MPNSVQVGGVEVTEKTLQQMHALLLTCEGCAYRRLSSNVPGYVPSLEVLRTCDGSRMDRPEDFLLSILTGHMHAPRAFKARFLSPEAQQPQQVSPIGRLLAAGFPTLAAIKAKTCDPAMKLQEWSKEIRPSSTPWLWIRGDDELARCLQVGQAALAFSRAMDEGTMAEGEIVYVTATDLCGEIDSLDRYGQQNKHKGLIPYKKCALLLLDGIGAERIGQASVETILQVVTTRWMNALPTVFASDSSCKAWVDRCARYDGKRAQALAAHIVSGLLGFRDKLDRTQQRELLDRHSIEG